MDCVKGMVSKVLLNMQVIMKPLSGLSDPPPSPLQAVKVVFLQHTLDNILWGLLLLAVLLWMHAKVPALSLTLSPAFILWMSHFYFSSQVPLLWGTLSMLFPLLFHFMQVGGYLLHEALLDQSYLKQSSWKVYSNLPCVSPIFFSSSSVCLLVDSLTIPPECNFHEARELSCFLFYSPNTWKSYLPRSRHSIHMCGMNEWVILETGNCQKQQSE